MRKATLITLFLVLSLFWLPAYASSATTSQEDPGSTGQVKDVLPQHKQEVSAIYKECLHEKHGAIIQCIQDAVEKLEEDVNILTDSKSARKTTPWQPSEEYAGRDNPTEATEENLNRGKEIFEFYCSGCHGFDGKGTEAHVNYGRPVADLTHPKLRERKDGELFWKITEGGWPMPAFWEGDVLGEEDIWVLIHYIRTLAAKQ